MPKAKKAKKPGRQAGGPNKSDFVRSMPNAKAGEVVAAAKAKGLTITAGLVYAVRSAGKAAKPKAGSKPKAAPGQPRAKGASDLATFNAFAQAVVAAGGSKAAARFLSALEALGI